MDITYDYYIEQINKFPNKKHWKSRYMQQKVNEHISGLRLTAFKMKGTVVGSFCMRESNRLERLLEKALNKRVIL